MIAAVLLGGRWRGDWPHFLPRPDLVVAADGGARHASALGLQLNAWVGDFDSSGALDLAAEEILRHPPHKAQTDGELAIEWALEAGARRLLLVGAFGGRFDHTSAVTLGAVALARRGVEVELSSGDEHGRVLLPGRDLNLPLVAGQTFSVVGLTALEALSISGAVWNLHQAKVEFGSALTISNEARGPVELSLGGGAALACWFTKESELLT